LGPPPEEVGLLPPDGWGPSVGSGPAGIVVRDCSGVFAVEDVSEKEGWVISLFHNRGREEEGRSDEKK
jgi:hypothetical protein